MFPNAILMNPVFVTNHRTKQKEILVQDVEHNLYLISNKGVILWKKKLNSQTPHIIFQFLVVKTNEHLIEEIKSLSNNLGVNELRIKTYKNKIQNKIKFNLLYDKNSSLQKKIKLEQLRKEIM